VAVKRFNKTFEIRLQIQIVSLTGYREGVRGPQYLKMEVGKSPSARIWVQNPKAALTDSTKALSSLLTLTLRVMGG
jgi:hypothetical protein